MFIARGTKPLRRRSEERKCACELEGLVGFRSSERRWSNISTRAINISLLRSKNRPARKSLADQLGAKLFGPFPSITFFTTSAVGGIWTFFAKPFRCISAAGQALRG